MHARNGIQGPKDLVLFGSLAVIFLLEAIAAGNIFYVNRGGVSDFL